MRAIIVVLGLACLAWLTGCDDDPASVGMSREPGDGELMIYAALCEQSERVIGVRLVEHASGAVLWEVDSQEGTREVVFKVGETPSGFGEVQPAVAPSAPNAVVRAEVRVLFGDGEAYWLGEQYRLASLRPGVVKAHGDEIPVDEWPEFVSDSYCSPGGGLFG